MITSHLDRFCQNSASGQNNIIPHLLRRSADEEQGCLFRFYGTHRDSLGIWIDSELFLKFPRRKILGPINPRSSRGLQGRPLPRSRGSSLRSPCDVWQSANPAQIASLGAPKRLKSARDRTPARNCSVVSVGSSAFARSLAPSTDADLAA